MRTSSSSSFQQLSCQITRALNQPLWDISLTHALSVHHADRKGRRGRSDDKTLKNLTDLVATTITYQSHREAILCMGKKRTITSGLVTLLILWISDFSILLDFVLCTRFITICSQFIKELVTLLLMQYLDSVLCIWFISKLKKKNTPKATVRTNSY